MRACALICMHAFCMVAKCESATTPGIVHENLHSANAAVYWLPSGPPGEFMGLGQIINMGPLHIAGISK